METGQIQWGQNGRGEAIDARRDRRGRITSYNVCYTKLLRTRKAGERPKAAPNTTATFSVSSSSEAKSSSVSITLPDGAVITSYSIHYTKLYDPDYPTREFKPAEIAWIARILWILAIVAALVVVLFDRLQLPEVLVILGTGP